MNVRQEYTPERLHVSRGLADEVIYIDDWRDHPSQPPTSALRQFDSTYEFLLVKQFAASVAADVVYGNYVLPSDIYRPKSVDVYLGWVPGASWTTGNYAWKFGYLAKAKNGSTLGSGTHTEATLDVTPSNATTLREDKITTVSLADTDGILGMRLYIGIGSSTANDVGEAAWVRFEYTAWRNGGRMHPGTRA